MLCKENIEEIAVEKSIFPADILVRVILFPAKLKLILEIHWYDHRLEFNNLKNMTSMNTIPAGVQGGGGILSSPALQAVTVNKKVCIKTNFAY